MTRQDTSFTMMVLRVWMWLVPIAMLIASVVFAVIAVSHEKWGLLFVMILAAVFSLSLLYAHWWLLYRFGREAGK